MRPPRILVIEARFYDHIADGLLKGAVAAIAAAGADHHRMTVPGILELPVALRFALDAQAGGGVVYDGYVVLGCAIRGETDHYAHVCHEAMRGIQDLALANSLAIGNGVLTVHNEKQALDRSEPERKNIGGLAARACLRMIALKRELAAKG